MSLRTTRDDLLPLDDYPILNQQEADKIFTASFLKDCGNNDVCESELVVLTSLSLKYAAENSNSEYERVLFGYRGREPSFPFVTS
jgi:hypothetical protein